MTTERGQGLAWFIATFAGLGERVPAPGTIAGSLPAALLWCALALVADRNVLVWCTALGVVFATAVGLWAAGLDSRRRGTEDPGPVVIDEVAGQWLSYLVVLPVLPVDNLKTTVLIAAAGFFAFRFFDITKVWPANRLEEIPGGAGIMADDLAAGVWAGLVVLAGWMVIG